MLSSHLEDDLTVPDNLLTLSDVPKLKKILSEYIALYCYSDISQSSEISKLLNSFNQIFSKNADLNIFSATFTIDYSQSPRFKYDLRVEINLNGKTFQISDFRVPKY